jgi:hypothetical protein
MPYGTRALRSSTAAPASETSALAPATAQPASPIASVGGLSGSTAEASTAPTSQNAPAMRRARSRSTPA